MKVRQVAFLQGDDATEIFKIMYPANPHNGTISNGSPRTLRLAHDVLIEYIDKNATGMEDLPTNGYTGHLSTKHFLMTWNYPHNWVALYQKFTKADIKRESELIAA